MNYKFSDLVDIDQPQTFFDSLYDATGIAAGVADIDGTILTRTGWTRLCRTFHRDNINVANRCIESISHNISNLCSKTIDCHEEHIYYRCKNGIMHAITPIFIQGKIMAVIYKSQFFLSPPDLEYFKMQAATLGFTEKEYIEAVQEVPVYSKEDMDKFMRFASQIARLFGEMGCNKLRLYEEQEKSEIIHKELMVKHHELVAIYEEIATMEKEFHSQSYQIEHQEEILKVSEECYQLALENAKYDKVTGLLNRSNITKHVSYALSVAKRENKKGALFFLDIDNFKIINDTFGHGFGDKVLKRLGKELQRNSGKDSIVARFGGDEFVILKREIKNKKDIVDTINNIKAIFDDPWVLDGYEIFPTVSIGITVFPDDGDITETLFKNADIAMYEAKRYGKNAYEFFKSSMNDNVIQRMKMDRDLRNALDRNEFSLVYQPQINSKTGRIEAVEALIRWNHPEKGLILPGQFIPFAEEIGLIIPIGEWVLRTACKQNKEWQDMGYDPVCVSVNISTLQLRRWNFIDLVQKILVEVELDPSYLELEITESNLMESMEDNIVVLDRLKQMGVRIALDDFGTGYSSLNYLQCLPIHNMKIDRTFVEDIINNNDKRYIAEVIIALAHRMNLEVTAEGVETEEQLRMLISRKCDRIQGFLFSKPLPVGEIERLLRRGRLDLSRFI